MSKNLFLIFERVFDSNNNIFSNGYIFVGDTKITGTTFCPVNLEVTNSKGEIVNKNVNQIPGANYEELDINNDGALDSSIELSPGEDNYRFAIIPKPEAGPNDKFSFSIYFEDGRSLNLESDQEVKHIDSNGYKVLILPLQQATPPSDQIPEFSTIAIPILSVIGLLFVLRRWR